MPDQIPLTQAQPLQNPLTTMSGILGLQQQKQALQTGQYAQETAQAGAATNQMVLGERQRVASYLSNPANKGKKAEDMADDLRSIAPTTAPEYIKKIQDNENGQIGIDQNLSTLSKDYKEQLNNVLGSRVGSSASNSDIEEDIHQAVLQNPKLAGTAYFMSKNIDNLPDPTKPPQGMTPQDAQQQRDKLLAAAQYKVSGKSPLAAGVRDQGTSATPIATNQITGSQTTTGPSYDKTTIGQTGTGQAALVGPKGVSVLPDRTPPVAPPVNASPRTAQDDAPGPNAPKAVQENYQAASQAAQKHVEDVRKADEGYGNNVSVANTIRHLAPNADTGPGRQTLNNALAGLGVQAGSNNQELGAFLDRQAAGLRSQMGLPATNEGAEQSKSIAGNTGYALPALMDKNDYTQSLVEGAHQYRHGLDRVAGFSGQASPKAVNEFKSAWADNFDPNVYKADLAKKQGKLSEFVNSLDPKEAATLAQKRKNLQSLSNGQIPQ